MTTESDLSAIAGQADDLVLYGIGVSTDPHGASSAPTGFGVATGLISGPPTRDEVEDPIWCSSEVEWLEQGAILVPRRDGSSPCADVSVFRFPEGHLVESDPALTVPFDDVWRAAWSPNLSLVAFEPSELMADGGIRPSGVIMVSDPQGEDQREIVRGHLAGWTADGRILYSTGLLFEFVTGDYMAVDPATGDASIVLPRDKLASWLKDPDVTMSKPAWSADGRYLATRVRLSPSQEALQAVVVAEAATGNFVEAFTSPYAISMLAWSPNDHRLAYTTSGFPTPHEIFVVSLADDEERLLFSASRHFDWITWSPDGQWLLLDDEESGHWRLLDPEMQVQEILAPRLGGRPIWCCPVNSYSAGFG